MPRDFGAQTGRLEPGELVGERARPVEARSERRHGVGRIVGLDDVCEDEAADRCEGVRHSGEHVRLARTVEVVERQRGDDEVEAAGWEGVLEVGCMQLHSLEDAPRRHRSRGGDELLVQALVVGQLGAHQLQVLVRVEVELAHGRHFSPQGTCDPAGRAVALFR